MKGSIDVVIASFADQGSKMERHRQFRLGNSALVRIQGSTDQEEYG
jgi:hypothetical protein